jgi:hypothetical protein
LEVEGAPQQPLMPQMPGREHNVDTNLPQ